MHEAWSDNNVAPGSTSTTKEELAQLRSDLAKGKKYHFYPLNKSDSILEVLGENPRIIVNEINTGPAAIWYGLYDGTLLDLLKDRKLKTEILNLLQTYFQLDTFPVIPILKTGAERKPKFKTKSETTRVYSAHGGANLRTFLNNKTYYPDADYYQIAFKEFFFRLAKLGFVVPSKEKIPKGGDEPTLEEVCFYLQAQDDIKKQLQALNNPDDNTKSAVFHLELFSKIFASLAFFDLIGVYHGHPHGGNIVTSWSKEQLSQNELEEELLSPKKIAVDYKEMLRNYPNCYLHPYYIDFDFSSFSSTGSKDLYDKSKLLALLESPNKMYQALALQLLPVELWPTNFIISLFTTNLDLLQVATLKLVSHRVDEALTPTLIDHFFSPVIKSGVSIDNAQLTQLITYLLPGEVTYSKLQWEHWLKYFQKKPSNFALKYLFLKVALQQSENAHNKEELIVVIENIVNDGKPFSKSISLLRKTFTGYRSIVEEVFGPLVYKEQIS
jgi:hypothetical protein